MPRLVPSEELDIVLQFAYGEITATQAGEKTGVGYPAAYRWLGGRLLRACRSGQVEVRLINPKK